MVAWAWASPLSSLEADAHRRRPSPTSLDFFFFCWNIWGVEIQKEKKIYINFFSQAWLPESDLPWSLWFWFQK